LVNKTPTISIFPIQQNKLLGTNQVQYWPLFNKTQKHYNYLQR